MHDLDRCSHRLHPRSRHHHDVLDGRCGDRARLEQQLTKDGIGFTEVNIEEVDGTAAIVESVNGGNQTVPTVIFPDGSTYEPVAGRGQVAPLAAWRLPLTSRWAVGAEHPVRPARLRRRFPCSRRGDLLGARPGLEGGRRASDRDEGRQRSEHAPEDRECADEWPRSRICCDGDSERDDEGRDGDLHQHHAGGGSGGSPSPCGRGRAVQDGHGRIPPHAPRRGDLAVHGVRRGEPAEPSIRLPRKRRRAWAPRAGDEQHARHDDPGEESDREELSTGGRSADPRSASWRPLRAILAATADATEMIRARRATGMRSSHQSPNTTQPDARALLRLCTADSPRARCYSALFAAAKNSIWLPSGSLMLRTVP